VNDDALGFVGVSIVAASSREEALALVQADLDEHENESRIDEREVTSDDLDTPRVLSVHLW